MVQTKEILLALKRALRGQGKTYADVAVVLNLSEASVKRLFSDGSLTLQRVEQILLLLGMDFTELVEQIQQARQEVELLSSEQEAQIAGDTALLIIALSVVNGFSFSCLQQHYCFSEHVLIQKLAQLDRLKMLELMPGNRIKLRLAHNFRWRKDGPIQNFFLKRIAPEFFCGQFDAESDKLLVFNGVISTAANAEVQARMEVFLNEINTLTQQEKSKPLKDRHGNTLVIALRQWQASVFQEYLNAPECIAREDKSVFE